MSIKVALVRDNIRGKGFYAPHMLRQDMTDFSRLIQLMEVTTGLSGTDLRSVFQLFSEALIFHLKQGGSVQTPLGIFSLGLRSRPRNSSQDDPDRWQDIDADDIGLIFRADRQLLKSIRSTISIDKVDAPALNLPVIRSVENVELGMLRDEGSPGQVFHIRGSRLGFSASDPDLGVFFVGTAPEAEATRMNLYIHRGSSIVDGMIPELAPGAHSLEIRTRPTSGEIRIGIYPGTIKIT